MDINKCKPHREGTHSKFSSSENRCTHIAKNPNRKYVRQFKVDGEVFPAGTAPKRCDYLLLNDTDRHSYYIELKGSDISQAIYQIESSIALIDPAIGYDIRCRIIYHTSTHEVNGAAAIRWKKKRPGAVITSTQYTDIL